MDTLKIRKELFWIKFCNSKEFEKLSLYKILAKLLMINNMDTIDDEQKY